MIMNSKWHAIAQWDFSRWFVALSPLIGVFLGLIGAFLVSR
jgi:ABC-type Mn2+/Zn2+ transport system permease subunit